MGVGDGAAQRGGYLRFGGGELAVAHAEPLRREFRALEPGNILGHGAIAGLAYRGQHFGGGRFGRLGKGGAGVEGFEAAVASADDTYHLYFSPSMHLTVQSQASSPFT